MIANHNVFLLIHIHLKKRFTTEDEKNIFFENLRKYVTKEAQKNKIGKTKQTKSGMKIHNADASIGLDIQKDDIHMIINSSDKTTLLSSVDKMLNKILIFLDTSEQKIEQVMTSFSKTSPLKQNPMMNLINREAITEFSTKVKKSFKPRAVHLTTGVEEVKGKEQEFSFMVSHDEDVLELEMTVETRSHGTIPLDLMVNSNKTINEYKNKVFTALGVRL